MSLALLQTKLDEQAAKFRRNAKIVCLDAYRAAIQPPEAITVAEWAESKRYLPKGSSVPGKWRNDLTPYWVEVMEALSPQSPVTDVVLVKCTQIGGTEVGQNMLLYYMDIDPTNILLVMPSDGVIKTHVETKLDPALASSGIRTYGRKRNQDSITEKKFAGGLLKIVSSNSATSARSYSARIVDMDDIDGYPKEIGEEGNTISLFAKRTDSYGIRAKRYKNSTPTTPDGHIWEAFQDSDQRYYYVPCPHCKGEFVFDFDGLKYNVNAAGDLASEVEYCCPSCGCLIRESEKYNMMIGGKWIPHNPGNPTRGYHINSLYSPLNMVSWRQIVKEYLAAKKAMRRGDASLMRTFVNTRKALPWFDRVEAVDAQLIFENNRSNPGAYDWDNLPEEALVLTCGVDVQDDRLEAEVVAWGRGEESWSVCYKTFRGNPAMLTSGGISGQETVWEQLSSLLDRTYTFEDGRTAKIACACIDSGGHHTKTVYRYVQPRQGRRVFAIRGASAAGAPPVQFSKKTTARVRLANIGTDGFKDTIYSRLKLTDYGYGYMHFPFEYGLEHFEQLTAERKEHNKKTGKWAWKLPSGRRNEPLDCRVYASAALTILSPDFDKMYEKVLALREEIEAATAAAETAVANEQDEITERRIEKKREKKNRVKRRVSGWING